MEIKNLKEKVNDYVLEKSVEMHSKLSYPGRSGPTEKAMGYGTLAILAGSALAPEQMMDLYSFAADAVPLVGDSLSEGYEFIADAADKVSLQANTGFKEHGVKSTISLYTGLFSYFATVPAIVAGIDKGIKDLSGKIRDSIDLEKREQIEQKLLYS